MEQITSGTFSGVSAAFGGLTIYSAVKSINTDDKKKRLTSAIAALILYIAYFHYSKMTDIYSSANFNQEQLTLIRYSDWIITVPLLIFELFLLMDWITVNEDGSLSSNNAYELNLCIVLSILMIITGYFGEISSGNLKYILFTFSLLCLLVITTIVYQLQDKHNEDKSNNWVLYIFGFWFFYILGFNQFVPNSNILYNLLDLITKGVFAFLTVTVL